jgi:hypothetical protein
MRKPVKLKTEEQFASIHKKAALATKEKAKTERSERIAYLRSLRLAKEATDLNVVDQAEAGKSPAKTKSNAKQLPRAHR